MKTPSSLSIVSSIASIAAVTAVLLTPVAAVPASPLAVRQAETETTGQNSTISPASSSPDATTGAPVGVVPVPTDGDSSGSSGHPPTSTMPAEGGECTPITYKCDGTADWYTCNAASQWQFSGSCAEGLTCTTREDGGVTCA